jgi:hypothetical protein
MGEAAVFRINRCVNRAFMNRLTIDRDLYGADRITGSDRRLDTVRYG